MRLRACVSRSETPGCRPGAGTTVETAGPGRRREDGAGRTERGARLSGATAAQQLSDARSRGEAPTPRPGRRRDAQAPVHAADADARREVGAGRPARGGPWAVPLGQGKRNDATLSPALSVSFQVKGN